MEQHHIHTEKSRARSASVVVLVPCGQPLVCVHPSCVTEQRTLSPPHRGRYSSGFVQALYHRYLLEEQRIHIKSETGEDTPTQGVGQGVSCLFLVKEVLQTQGPFLQRSKDYIMKRPFPTKDLLHLLFVKPRSIIYSSSDYKSCWHILDNKWE